MIIPVLDLKNGKAVSGKSGMRKTYKPLKTVYNDSSDPVAISRALKKAGYTRIYLADLDSIEKTGSNVHLAVEINDIIPVMLDAGIQDSEDAEKIFGRVQKTVIATETIKNLDELESIFSIFPKHSLVMSVDIKDGKILGKNFETEFSDILKIINKIKPFEIILLDISRVGTGNGFDQELLKPFKDIDTEIILGGGVNPEDITELVKMGIHKFLVGTALHNGIIKRS